MRPAGRRVVAVDSSIGIAAGVALAAAMPELPHACGLATVQLLAGDVIAESLVPDGGMLAPRPVVADEDLLARWAAPPERATWWRSRVAAAHAHLDGSGP